MIQECSREFRASYCQYLQRTSQVRSFSDFHKKNLVVGRRGKVGIESEALQLIDLMDHLLDPHLCMANGAPGEEVRTKAPGSTRVMWIPSGRSSYDRRCDKSSTVNFAVA